MEYEFAECTQCPPQHYVFRSPQTNIFPGERKDSVVESAASIRALIEAFMGTNGKEDHRLNGANQGVEASRISRHRQP